MPLLHTRSKALVLLGAVLAATAAETRTAVTAVPLPSGPDAGMYSLAGAGPDGAVLSWLESSSRGRAFRFSSYRGGRWTAPRTIAEGEDLFSNWADHPSMAAMEDGTLLAQWPVTNPARPAAGSYNNSLRIAVSRDQGTTWREVFADGKDNVHSYSGFVSLLPGRDGFSAVYLTPPRPVSHDPADHTMTLSHVSVDGTGAATGPRVLDADACSCCPTAFAATSNGPIAAYRDHVGEVRDIAIVRLVSGAWTAPRPVHQDGWRINGCPTNGPELAASGRTVAAAWFTAAGDQPRMKVAFSDDAGASFGAPAVVDAGRPVGRGALVLLPDRSAAVAWLENTANGGGELRLRRVSAAGQTGPALTVGPASPGRTTGMLQMVRVGASLLIVWRGDRGLSAASVPVAAL